MLRTAPLILAALAVAAPSAPAQEPLVTQGEVNQAIDRGVRALLRAQGQDGSWPGGRPGRTALALYALLKSGVAPDHRAVQHGLQSVWRNEPRHTYDVALLIQVLATLEQPEYQEWIEVLAERLVAWQLDTGDWSYPQGEGDLSNTQYAALGLWTAGKAGTPIPVEAWERLFEGVQRYASRQGDFGYSRGARGVRPSMTAAGVATLAICEWGLREADELSPRTARLIERAEERGVEALARDVDSALSAISGGWPCYTLYAVERVGALLALQRLGEVDWYQQGAANLLVAQNEDGSWGGGRRGGGGRGRGDPWSDVRTAFALLFLRRATSFTGTGGDARRTAFGTSSADDDVQVRATGADPLTLWITGWSPAVRERFEWPGEEGDGPHVGRVEYLVDGQVAAVVEADPYQPSGIERYAVQHELPRSGVFRVEARVSVYAPPREGDDEPGPPSVISSPPFEVEVSGVVPAWVRAQLGDRRRNLMAAAEPSVRASSALREGGADHAPERAVDNFGLSAWLARPDDEKPSLSIRLGDPQRADVILLASPRTVPYREGWYARPMEVEVVINEDETYRVLVPPDERRKARLELERPERIRQLDLTIRWKAPGRVESTGLAEVELQLR